MTSTKIAILVLAVIGLALLLAIVIHRISQWWNSKTIGPFDSVDDLIAALDRPVERPALLRRLREMNVLAPHRSAARPSNVMTIARKRVQKSPPKAAA